MALAWLTPSTVRSTLRDTAKAAALLLIVIHRLLLNCIGDIRYVNLSKVAHCKIARPESFRGRRAVFADN
jgi:hypothetical protein